MSLMLCTSDVLGGFNQPLLSRTALGRARTMPVYDLYLATHEISPTGRRINHHTALGDWNDLSNLGGAAAAQCVEMMNRCNDCTEAS